VKELLIGGYRSAGLARYTFVIGGRMDATG